MQKLHHSVYKSPFFNVACCNDERLLVWIVRHVLRHVLDGRWVSSLHNKSAGFLHAAKPANTKTRRYCDDMFSCQRLAVLRVHIYSCFCARLYEGPTCKKQTIHNWVCFCLHLQCRGEPLGNCKLTELSGSYYAEMLPQLKLRKYRKVEAVH